MQIPPILAALRSHKTAVTLLVLEIALTMAILGNLVFIVYGTIVRSQTPTGVTESQIGLIQSIGVVGVQNSGTAAENLITLRQVPGVIEAAFGAPPLWRASRDPIFLDADRQHAVTQAYAFMGSQSLVRTLGVHVVQGRDLHSDELPTLNDVFAGAATASVPVLITRALGQRLFGNRPMLGQIFYGGNLEMRVIGVIDHLRSAITGKSDDDYALVMEFALGSANLGGGYLIRSQPGRLPQTLLAAAKALQKTNPGHVQHDVSSMSELREEYFRSDLATGRMLIAIIFILLVVTALGVSGLASFWVQQRRRQIGMRRALGATRGDILRYFQTENFLIVSGGVLMGVLFAYGLNLFLMRRFELAHLPAGYLLVGAVTLWLLGQLAVLGPALRAAAVSPVVATRSG